MDETQGEKDGFNLHSQLDGAISALSAIKQSLLFAELSAIAYMPKNRAVSVVAPLGLTSVQLLERDGAEVYVFESEVDCVVACRGTEPTQLNDIKADLKASQVIAETVGKVHQGFKDECDDLWPMLEVVLKNNTKTLYFCGHSLGAAMATICASRCRLSHIESDPIALFSYGSPRVGNVTYMSHCKIEHTRWVNNNDVVTQMPPCWLGYQHVGKEMYLNAYGQLRSLTGWQRVKDRMRGMLMGLKEGNIDSFSDHFMVNYIRYIHQISEEKG